MAAKAARRRREGMERVWGCWSGICLVDGLSGRRGIEEDGGLEGLARVGWVAGYKV